MLVVSLHFQLCLEAPLPVMAGTCTTASSSSTVTSPSSLGMGIRYYDYDYAVVLLPGGIWFSNEVLGSPMRLQSRGAHV